MIFYSKLRRVLVLAVVVAACALFATGCDDIIADPNFHTWCGDQLCSWKLESGQIAKAATWHPNDYGVSLLDDPGPDHLTAISQGTEQTPHCLDFMVVADVVAEAQVSVQVDFNSDGTVDYEAPIAEVGFKEQKTQVTAPDEYRSIKITIAKKGTGRAVLAQLDVHEGTDCNAASVTITPQALGTPCVNNAAACQSGICCNDLCAECCSSPFGSPTCTECGALALDNPTSITAIPQQCNPGMLQRASGAECLLNGDCTSNMCDGALWSLVNVLEDGGTCPAPPAQSNDCSIVAVHGGRCR